MTRAQPVRLMSHIASTAGSVPVSEPPVSGSGAVVAAQRSWVSPSTPAQWGLLASVGEEVDSVVLWGPFARGAAFHTESTRLYKMHRMLEPHWTSLAGQYAKG